MFPFVLCRTVPEIFFSPDLSLPNQSMQNHIHELAKSLPVPQPAPRKQNTACDACRLADQCILCLVFLIHVRSRKVKCNRIPGQDKVPHISYVSQPSTYHSWVSYSARSALTTIVFNILTCAAALHIQELSMHVRATRTTITYIILTSHCRHFVQQATSEKKRMTVNRRRNLSSASSRWVPCQQL